MWVTFTDAPTLTDRADVRAAGVTIGKVVDRKLAPGANRTLATIELDGGICSTVPGSKSNGHGLPHVIVSGEESLPALKRTKGNRGNAYLQPDSSP